MIVMDNIEALLQQVAPMAGLITDLSLAENANKHRATTCLSTQIINTPLGNMLAVFTTHGLCLLEFIDQPSLLTQLKAIQQATNSYFKLASDMQLLQLNRQLGEFFAGTRQQFDIPLDEIGTDFQKQVWAILRTIPYGKTISYKEQATAFGNTDAIRAVANANSKNKVAIITPCHRVIGSSGKLVGYAGGLSRKQALLDIEKGNDHG